MQVWRIIFDWGTLGFLMYNFAVGGVVSVFWQKGVPRIVTQVGMARWHFQQPDVIFFILSSGVSCRRICDHGLDHH